MSSSKLEDSFYFLWLKHNKELKLTQEHQFAKCIKRRWRFDFAHLPSQVAIEIEGGTFGIGRHTNCIGYAKDCEKYNNAILLGWKVFRLTSKMITIENVETIGFFIKNSLDN